MSKQAEGVSACESLCQCIHACMPTERPAYSPFCIVPTLGRGSKTAELNGSQTVGDLYLTVPGRTIELL